jgi:uncharacterized protein YbaR (Trm112 family)
MSWKNQLEILRCPQDRSALSAADDALVARLNAEIQRGRLRNQGGRPVKKKLDGGLVREAGDLLYPVLDEIPLLLADEAIRLAPAAKS